MDSNIVKIIFICVTVLLLCFTILENISRTISIPDQLVHLVNYINNSVTNVSQNNRFNDGEICEEFFKILQQSNTYVCLLLQ